MKLGRLLFLIAAGIVISANAVANAGTPLMWMGMFHLVLGNAIIGLLEGLALAVPFRLGYIKTVVLMIAANYSSAWAGWLLIQKLVPVSSLDIYTIRSFVFATIAVTLLLSLAVEFPFVLTAFYKKRNWTTAAWSFLVVQTTSYLLLFGIYAHASTFSLLTDANLVDVKAMNLPNNIVVSYTATDGQVRSICLPDPKPGQQIGQYAPSRIHRREDDQPWLPGTENSLVAFNRGGYAYDGLMWTEKNGRLKSKIALETPFAMWYVRHLTHLPNDIALFQLGTDQVCLFDPATYQLALLAKGTQPVASAAHVAGK